MLRQIFAVLQMNILSLPRRLGGSLVIILGIAGVVGVLISVLALATGFQRATASTGSPERAIIMSAGALGEALSSIQTDAVPNIISAPGIAKDSQGRSVADPEVLAQLQVVSRGSNREVNVTLRGVGVTAFELRPELHLVAGRMFRAGLHELIVGHNAQEEYAGLDIGSHISFQNGDWVVVGTFASTRPSMLEAELLADGATLLSAYQRNWYQSVTVGLSNPAALKRLQDAIKADSTLKVDVQRESDYTAAQSQTLTTVLDVIGYFVGGVMAVGAVFGALNTLYAAVSVRSREIAQLRAIGFGGTPVVISVISEALLLSLAGALTGALIAWLLFNGHVTSMLGSAFSMRVTPALVGFGVIWGLGIGMLGGLFPAIRAGRLPIARALTALA